MLLVLFTIVSARLDSIMLTMLFSGYNIEALTDHTDHNTQSRPLCLISLSGSSSCLAVLLAAALPTCPQLRGF